MSTIDLSELEQSIKTALSRKLSIGPQVLNETQRAQVRSNLGFVNQGFIDINDQGLVEMSPSHSTTREPGYVLSVSRDSDLPAGSQFGVPYHTINSNRLLVFVGMAKCTRGIEYNDVNENTISFTEAIPANYRIEVYSL